MNKVFSIIIPHRNSVQFLPKLFASIPKRDDIEIILVDNSPIKTIKKDINTDRDYILLYSDPSRGAGGARNVGLDNANGKWLLFADADDYFSANAFDIFYQHINDSADIIYTGMGGIYIDTGMPSSRGDEYTEIIKHFLQGKSSEFDLRFRFTTPCCKMVRHSLIKNYHIQYDEVTASNDMYFSMLCGYYAKKIVAIDFISYIATVSKGTLTQRRDYKVIRDRLYVCLRYNHFLKTHGYSKYQRSILYYLLLLCKMGIRPAIESIKLIIYYKQNPFIGWKNWVKSIKEILEKNRSESKYIQK